MRKIILISLLCSIIISSGYAQGSSENAFRFYLVTNSGERTEINIKQGITSAAEGRLLIEADPNDPNKEIYDKEMQIELTLSRGTLALNRSFVKGLNIFNEYDIMEKIREKIQAGDKIFLELIVPPKKNGKVYTIRVRKP